MQQGLPWESNNDHVMTSAEVVFVEKALRDKNDRDKMLELKSMTFKERLAALLVQENNVRQEVDKMQPGVAELILQNMDSDFIPDAKLEELLETSAVDKKDQKVINVCVVLQLLERLLSKFDNRHSMTFLDPTFDHTLALS